MGLQDARLSPGGNVNPMPTSTMVEMLVPIWQRVLQLPSIGVDDNFFEVGGDSSLALALFNEIAQACGRELPPVMIYHAPTIAALAAVLEDLPHRAFHRWFAESWLRRTARFHHTRTGRERDGFFSSGEAHPVAPRDLRDAAEGH